MDIKVMTLLTRMKNETIRGQNPCPRCLTRWPYNFNNLQKKHVVDYKDQIGLSPPTSYHE
jgi:hypothetical protein